MGKKEFTQKTNEKFPEYFKVQELLTANPDLSMAKACEQAGADIKRYYNWRRLAPDFKSTRGYTKRISRPIDIPVAKVERTAKGKLAVIVGDANEVGSFLQGYFQ